MLPYEGQVNEEAAAIAFIVCVNDDAYFEECQYYINRLHIPEGYKTEILAVREADSMCAAYNLAMRSTAAKYKVYLHQDVYLLKESMLCDMLEIFKDDTIGMIGTVGARNLPKNAKAAQSWDCGNVLVYNGSAMIHMRDLNCVKNDVIDVEAIDGMLMMTQYDIAWDEQTFCRFHFYDISQCMEFRKRGYRVVLPKDDEVWALHDSGISAESGYDEYRRRFCEKYKQDGFVYNGSEDIWYSRIGCDLERRKKQILEKAQEEVTPELLKSIEEFEKAGYRDTEIFCLKEYLEIIDSERNVLGRSRIQEQVGWPAFQEIEQKIRMLCWRVEFKRSKEAAQEIVNCMAAGWLSLEAVQIIVGHCVIDQRSLWQELARCVNN